MDFEKESEIMDMKEEMMNDAIDDVVRPSWISLMCGEIGRGGG
jgi:hypothetical protein